MTFFKSYKYSGLKIQIHIHLMCWEENYMYMYVTKYYSQNVNKCNKLLTKRIDSSDRAVHQCTLLLENASQI